MKYDEALERISQLEKQLANVEEAIEQIKYRFMDEGESWTSVHFAIEEVLECIK
jgi:hypothetical protein